MKKLNLPKGSSTAIYTNNVAHQIRADDKLKEEYKKQVRRAETKQTSQKNSKVTKSEFISLYKKLLDDNLNINKSEPKKTMTEYIKFLDLLRAERLTLLRSKNVNTQYDRKNSSLKTSSKNVSINPYFISSDFNPEIPLSNQLIWLFLRKNINYIKSYYKFSKTEVTDFLHFGISAWVNPDELALPKTISLNSNAIKIIPRSLIATDSISSLDSKKAFDDCTIILVKNGLFVPDFLNNYINASQILSSGSEVDIINSTLNDSSHFIYGKKRFQDDNEEYRYEVTCHFNGMDSELDHEDLIIHGNKVSNFNSVNFIKLYQDKVYKKILKEWQKGISIDEVFLSLIAYYGLHVFGLKKEIDTKYGSMLQIYNYVLNGDKLVKVSPETSHSVKKIEHYRNLEFAIKFNTLSMKCPDIFLNIL